MAKLDGGVFSRPRGKTGGLVFGAARTRQGKVATVRQLVPPSNPNTAAQQTQRSKFSEALEIVRQIGKSIYGSDWNRSISQLPGFQSMMSIFMNNMDDQFIMSVPAETNLGSLYIPTTIVDGAFPANQVGITFDTGNGPNGTNQDENVCLAIAANPGASPSDREVKTAVGVNIREEGEAGVTDVAAASDFLIGFYLIGAGTAEGLVSNAEWIIATSG